MNYGFIDPEVEAYAERYTAPEPALLQRLSEETWKATAHPQMISSRLSGRFLKMLVAISGARRILEVGMFTGYSALSMAESLPEDGKLITCEIDPEVAKMAQSYFRKSPHGHKIDVKLGPALATLQGLSGEFDMVFIDADKGAYRDYYELSLAKLKRGGLIVIDNCLWSGRVLRPGSSEDQVLSSLNELIARDDRVENVILTVRDGLNLVRKK